VLAEDFWRKDPKSAESMIREAVDRAREKQLPEALVSDFEVALAYTLIHQQRFAEAKAVIAAILRRRPGYDQARWCDALLLAALGARCG
jgi:hypothetical protein